MRWLWLAGVVSIGISSRPKLYGQNGCHWQSRCVIDIGRGVPQLNLGGGKGVLEEGLSNLLAAHLPMPVKLNASLVA